MSLKNFALVWEHPWPNVYQLAAAMVIARWSYKRGFCYASQAAIAKAACMSERKLRDVLQEMEALGTVRLERTTKPAGGNGVTHVYLTISGQLNSEAEDFPEEAGIWHSAASASGTYVPGGSGTYVPGDAAQCAGPSKKRESKSESEESFLGADAPDDETIAFREWNDLARRLDLPVATKLTDSRRKRLQRRLAEGGIDAWRQALAAVEGSKWLRGISNPKERGWRADFDFMVQAKSFQKMIEGGYDQDAPRPRPDQTPALRRRLATDRDFALSHVKRWDQDKGSWPDWAGPPPGDPACLANPEALHRMQIETRALQDARASVDPIARHTGTPLPPSDDEAMLT